MTLKKDIRSLNRTYSELYLVNRNLDNRMK